MAESQFRHQLKSGVIYTAIAKYSSIVVSLLVTAILSRLLPPEDFGVIAVATVFIVFFSIFSDMGLSSAIVQKRELSKDDYKSLFSFTVYVGLILAIVFFLSSWLIAKIYDDDQLIIICQILAVNVLFATWNIVPNGLLFRDKRFKFIGLRTIIIQLILATISIVGAFMGLGIYALLVNPVGSSILLFLISYIKYPVGFNLKPKFEAVRKVASYSVFTFGFSIINYFTRNLDKLMIGKIFGMVPLGYYEKSYRMMLLPVQNLTQVITPVLHPVLADFQNDLNQQVRKYLKLIEILSLIGFPISVFLYFSAEPLIIMIFGNQWGPSVPVFRILSLTVGLQITGSTMGAFYQASNFTRQMFMLGVVNTIVNICGLMIGIYALKTIEGVGWMWVVTCYIGLWNNWYFAKVTKTKVIDTFKPYVPAILPSLIIAMLLCIINYIWNFNNIVSLIINLLVSGIVILFFLNHYKIFNVCVYIRRIIHK